ncbi:MAG: hypothetical protein KDA39_08125 [Hyphomonas sp.]|nr:hypothetical protein [Hyphomonas sp.]
MVHPSRLLPLAAATLLCLAGCDASGSDRTREEPGRSRLPAEESDAAIAADARNILFGQLGLYEVGADARQGTPLAGMLAQMGREDLIEPPEDPRLTRCGQRWVDPIVMLNETARSYQAIVIADAPDAPRQRAFLSDLLEPLTAQGFETFAPDGFSLQGQARASAELPLLTDGLSLREPIEGRLVRRAKSLGMAVVSYQPTATQMLQIARLPQSEQGGMEAEIRAENLIVQVFLLHPEARVVVQATGAASAGALAAQLRERAGIKALSVLQVRCAGLPGRTVAMHPYGGVDGLARLPDLLVGHPEDAALRGRPAWRQRAGDVAVEVPGAFLTARLPVLVEARRLDEPRLAVPEDRLLLRPGETLPLMLPPGAYRVEAWTKNGQVADAVDLNVDDTP